MYGNVLFCHSFIDTNNGYFFSLLQFIGAWKKDDKGKMKYKGIQAEIEPINGRRLLLLYIYFCLWSEFRFFSLSYMPYERFLLYVRYATQFSASSYISGGPFSNKFVRMKFSVRSNYLSLISRFFPVWF